MSNYYLTDYEMEQTKGIQTLVFTPWQIKEIRKKTPESQIEIIKDGDKEYRSVKPEFVKKRLNYIFGWNYDTKIISKEYYSSNREAVVTLKLKIKSLKTIKREQFGGSFVDVRHTENGNIKKSFPVNIANSYKSATTNALKKCCSEIGMFWDVYTSEPKVVKPSPEINLNHSDKKQLEKIEMFFKACDNSDDLEIQYDKIGVDNPDASFSSELIEAIKISLARHEKRLLK